MDPGMNQLLKWGIENSDATTVDPSASTDPTAERSSGRPLNSEALQALLGGPSNADLMKSSMAAIQSGEVPLDQKLVAFDNFEQLIENIDNANNMESLGLWTPLVELLGDEQAEIRRMAAWCIGTAVQNNERAQEKLVVFNAIPILVKLALGDSNEGVRKKATYALSSEIRNYQVGANIAIKALPESLKPKGHFDAGEMEAVDEVIQDIRDHAKHTLV